MKTEFESGQECARAEVLAELKAHWGHDIVRGIAWKLCDRWGWDKPLATPSAVHPSPAAPGSAAPAEAEEPGWPEPKPPAPPSLPPMGCLPPGSRAEVTNSIRAEQSAPPTAQAPDYETARLWANRLNAEWFERLGKLEARLSQQEKQIEALWAGPCAPEPGSPASLAWHRWIWGYVEPILKRLEALEQPAPSDLPARVAKLEQFLQNDLRRARAALGLPPE